MLLQLTTSPLTDDCSAIWCLGAVKKQLPVLPWEIRPKTWKLFFYRPFGWSTDVAEHVDLISRYDGCAAIQNCLKFLISIEKF
ncbi:hypothetical protein ES703_101908 [subsurface metagenome]